VNFLNLRKNKKKSCWHTCGTGGLCTMATLRKRGKRWHVQVRRKSRPSVTRSFLLKSDAVAWATSLGADRQGIPTAHKGPREITIADVVSRYRDEAAHASAGLTAKHSSSMPSCVTHWPTSPSVMSPLAW
jgi:hypothetical protein